MAALGPLPEESTPQQRLTKVKDGLHNPVWKNGFRPTELLRVIQLKNPDQLDVRCQQRIGLKLVILHKTR